jgi:eukaryotic-like serine/threonine-protein kinase
VRNDTPSQSGAQSGALGEVDPLVGLTISGRYRVHTLIGQGGMGKVFRAQQIPLGRPVALKVLEAHRVDPDFQRRFFQEAAILARLQNPHTVTIYDYGRDNDIYFIAMEFVSGGALDKVLEAEGPLAASRVLSLAQQICRSLRDAHGQGVIHRDLKPANVVLAKGEDGEELIKVLDFGLAKRLNATIPEDTQRDVVPGSPKYMAPELIRQQPIDGRTDIYSLGVMMYQMLAGAVPFDHATAVDILYAHLHEAPEPLSQRNPNAQIPKELEQLVMRCLAKTPDQRPAGARELYEALHAIELALNGAQRGRRGTPPVDPARSGMRPSAPSLRLTTEDMSSAATPPPQPRSQRRVLVAAGVLAALIASGALLWQLGSEPSRALDPPGASEPEPVLADVTAQVATDVAAEQPESEPATETAPSADMVFSAKELGAPAQRSVTLIVTSEPKGARVLVRGRELGLTPGRFELRGSAAQPGASVTVQFALDGYAMRSVQRTIDARELEISAVLDPSSAQAPDLAPPPAPGGEIGAAAPDRARRGENAADEDDEDDE